MTTARDAEHRAAGDMLRARVAELEQSVAVTEQAWQKRGEELTAQMAGHEAERKRLSSALEGRTAENQRLSAMLERREAEHQQLSSMLEQRAADHQTAADSLQQQVHELQRTLKASEQEWQKRSDELTAQLAEHAAARLQLANALTKRDTDHHSTGH